MVSCLFLSLPFSVLNSSCSLLRSVPSVPLISSLHGVSEKDRAQVVSGRWVSSFSVECNSMTRQLPVELRNRGVDGMEERKEHPGEG